MPAPIHYSHKILRLMAEDRKSETKNIEPDSKSQITIEYKDGKPANVKSVVISTQHSSDVNQSQVRDLVKPYIEKSIPKELLNKLSEEEDINPTGNFVIEALMEIVVNWKKNNCGYIWRCCTTWRWRFFR